MSDTSLVSYKAAKRRTLDAFDRQYLARLMGEFSGNVTRAARRGARNGVTWAGF